MGERIEPVFVVTTTPGPHVEFVELENEDGSGAEVPASVMPYMPYKEGLWRLGPLYRVDEIERLRTALQRIQQWDCLNPPDPTLCADHPWLKQLVDEALSDA